jgi:alpha-glucosidase (family GH31 glycosyl hydrolase)
MASESDGSSHGVFLYNSHAIGIYSQIDQCLSKNVLLIFNKDVTTMPQPGITFRTIGGLLDFFVFLGPEPETVVQQYTGLIGRTFMPPYFALGFQLSRWGYKNTEDIRQVIERTKSFDIPQVLKLQKLQSD